MNLCQKYGRNTTCFLGSQTNFLPGVAIGFCMYVVHLGSSGRPLSFHDQWKSTELQQAPNLGIGDIGVETPHPKGHLFGHPPGHLAEKDANNYQQSQYISISYPPNTKPLHKAPGWERTLLPWRGMGLVASFCHPDLRPQHRSTMVTQINLDQVQTPRPLQQFWNKLPSTRCRILPQYDKVNYILGMSAHFFACLNRIGFMTGFMTHFTINSTLPKKWSEMLIISLEALCPRSTVPNKSKKKWFQIQDISSKRRICKRDPSRQAWHL